MSYVVVAQHQRLDTILSRYRSAIGAQWEGYRNHCFTVYNLTRIAINLDAERDDIVAIATAFHDIALWSDDRIDYLEPSMAHAVAFCKAEGRPEIAPLVSDMILYHHKIFPGSLARFDPLVRAFRNADWSAFTFGMIPFDRYTTPRRAVAAAFPDAGFHDFLAKRTIRHLRSGGVTNPLPMMKW
jgi:hypothetical protein